MKKIINRPERVVVEMCHGMALAHPQLEFIEKYKLMLRKNRNPQKVSLISGGGSGHEPAHAGYVGRGMLDAAVCGDEFASPSQIQVYNAIKAVNGNKGTLLIIKNYSGDMMNFKNAAQLAQEDGIAVDYVRVDDDIAVQDSLYTVGRRGVAGTVFVHKIAGAAAERGYDLPQVKAAAEKAIANVKSIGFALTSCTVPAKGAPTFSLAEDEMEYGVGIHGEPGIRRETVVPADEMAHRMVDTLLQELHVENGAEVAVLVNGLGGTPVQELYVLNHSVRQELYSRGVGVVLTLVGNYMTSIDMAGASLSILKLDSECKELLLDTCDTVGLRIDGEMPESRYWSLRDESVLPGASFTIETNPAFAHVARDHISLQNVLYMVDAMSECVIKNEVPFCELDSYAGDGDFGMSVAKGFRRLKEEWADISAECATVGDFLSACAMVIMEHCGGASGPIWGSAFRAAAVYAGNKTVLSRQEFAQMLHKAVAGIQATGERSFGRGAVLGDKTLLDALIPCVDAWLSLADSGMTTRELFAKGAESAVRGAEQTKQIVARMGRAGTVGERSLGHPDAGAYALGVIFSDIAGKLSYSG